MKMFQAWWSAKWYHLDHLWHCTNIISKERSPLMLSRFLLPSENRLYATSLLWKTSTRTYVNCKKSKKDFYLHEMLNASLLYATSAYDRFYRNTLIWIVRETSTWCSRLSIHSLNLCTVRTNLLIKSWKTVRFGLRDVNWRPFRN